MVWSSLRNWGSTRGGAREGKARVSIWQAHNLVGVFAEMVVDVREPSEIWPDMLELLQETIGFDAGYIGATWGAAMEGRGAVVGHDEPFLKGNLGRFLAELSPREVAAYSGRSCLHDDVWPISRQRQLAVFNEVLVPTGMRHMLVRASVRRGNVAGFNLERRGTTSRFSEAQRHLVDVVAPFLHIVEVLALEAGQETGLEPFVEAYGLTRREAEFVQLVIKGLKNVEIAMLTRVSAHTVRNTLARVFGKVGVTTRAELTYCATRFSAEPGAPAAPPGARLPDDGIESFKALVQGASLDSTPTVVPPRRRSQIIYTPPRSFA